MRRKNQRGSAAVEVGLIAVPMLCMFLGTAELGRCMWMFHTLASATKTAARYAVVHGENCVAASASCASTVGNISRVVHRASPGLDGNRLALHFVAGDSSVDCSSLSTCEGLTTPWPPASHNTAGKQISIRANYNFVSVISGFWPGQRNGTVQLNTQTTEAIQF